MPIRRIGLITRTYRHANRYRQILTVLVRYGFEGLVERLRIAQYLGMGLQLLSPKRRATVETLTIPVRLRMVLEELGPTFVKLGQVLSTRPDLLSKEFIEELSKLQQGVPPVPSEQVRTTIEHELKRPLGELFERFDEVPIAAASIGQVHRARLRSGEEVVVKVQRPNIRSVVEVDLEILLHLAVLGERHLEGWKLHRPSRLVEEFARTIEHELDFRSEVRQLERFAAHFRGDQTIYVPRVCHPYTTSRVLTMEYVEVIPVGDQAALERAGISPRVLAERGVQLTLKQIFSHGFFHADPHPGNVFALPGDRVCLLDFGMMGRLDRRAREEFADLIYAVAQRNPGQAATALLRLTEHDLEEEPDRRRLERDVEEFIDLYIPAELRDLEFGRLAYALIDLVTRHHLRIPPDLVMMLKAAATVERLVARLDPRLNFISAAEPFVRDLKVQRWHPGYLLARAIESGADLLEIARDLPDSARDLLHLAKRGGLKIGFEHRGLDRFIDSNERIANRLSFAVVVAALIVGSSLIVLSGLPPKWHEIPVIGLVGFIAAGIFGFLLLIAIIRHGRL